MTVKFDGKKTKVPMSTLAIDPALQMRAGGLDMTHAEDLAADLGKGDKLPEPWVIDVDGHGLLVVGGFHTVKAHEINGKQDITVLVRKGSYGEALIEAAGSNHDVAHRALKPTREDKQRGVRMALRGNELLTVRTRWSDRKIAEHIGVSHTMVSEMRKEIEARANGTPTPKKQKAKAEAKDEPKEKAEVITSIQSDQWQGWPLDEAIRDLPDYVEAAIKASGIKTVGRLLEHLDEGVTLGLNKAPLKSLRERLETIRTGSLPVVEPPRDLPQRFDWQARERSIAAGCRAMESIANEFQIDRKGEEYKAVDAAFKTIQSTFAAWRKQHGK